MPWAGEKKRRKEQWRKTSVFMVSGPCPLSMTAVYALTSLVNQRMCSIMQIKFGKTSY